MSRVSSLAINAADHLISKGRLDAAASILRNYLSTNQPKAEVLQRLGRILLAQGRSEEAVPLLQRALTQFKHQQNISAQKSACLSQEPVLPVDQEFDSAAVVENR